MKTRMLKAQCGTCAYTVRVARSWLARALPKCPLCDERMESAEYAAVIEAELEEAQAWYAGETGAACTTLTDKWVQTRVPHVCNGCRVECQRDEKMRHRVYVIDGEMLSEYTCMPCDARALGRTEQGGRRALARA